MSKFVTDVLSQQNPAPLGDGPKPDFPSSAGSDHNKSHKDP